VLDFLKSYRSLTVSLFFAGLLAGVGCHAQVPAADLANRVSPELARRIEILIREKSSVPAEYSIVLSPKRPSDLPHYDEVDLSFTDGQKSSRPLTFLVSNDGKTLVQLTRYDISKDPKTLVSADNRPGRGGPATAPVTIVLFDDLECPFCARMHAQLFPALTARYGNEVRVVYRDFPLDQHPWAMRAAIDSNCLAAQSGTGYWNLVDYVHAHAGELGGADKSLATANEALDALTLDEGKKQKVDDAVLAACVKKQDAAPIEASKHAAEGLGVEATPALFINGEKLEGAQPIEYVYRMVDSALTAEGIVPPPPVPVAAPAPATPAAAAVKPGAGK